MISPSMGEAAAQRVAEAYRDAELRILRRIADSLAVGIDEAEWEVLQLGRLQRVRDQVLLELARVNAAAAAAISDEIATAYTQGTASALSDVRGFITALEAIPPAQSAAVAALAADTAAGLASAAPGILRHVDDVYRQVIARATADVLTGTVTRRDAAQSAVSSLLGRGLNAIETARGSMSLPTYATMAVRTATARSALAGQIEQMTQLDLDLVTIQPGPRTCDICDEWAGLILTVNGVPGTTTAASLTDGSELDIEIDATLDDARDAGWGHPNCRCNLAAYLPGVSTKGELERPPWDQEGYEAQQQQRGIERNIRGWKEREALALDPSARADAAGKVSEWQAAQREHLKAHDYLKRQSAREQVGHL